MNDNIKKDIYFEILQWANQRFIFDKQELIDTFPNEKELILREIEHSKLFNSISPGNDKFFLTFNDRFKLLQYDALEQANKDSKEAKNYAIIAICITTFVGIIQIFVSIFK